MALTPIRTERDSLDAIASALSALARGESVSEEITLEVTGRDGDGLIKVIVATITTKKK